MRVVLQVPQKLAACISLPDKTKARLKAIPELSKALTVNIEPATEEDWEILESRPDSAEEIMLTQVSLLYIQMLIGISDLHNLNNAKQFFSVCVSAGYRRLRHLLLGRFF